MSKSSVIIFAAVAAILFSAVGAVAQEPPTGTIYIGPAACSSYGTWNAATNTCTLVADIPDMVEITGNSFTLDCAGKQIYDPAMNIWAGPPYGIYLSGKTGVTIKNCTTSYFIMGIFLRASSNNNIITANTANNNYIGIRLDDSNSNTLTFNTANYNMLDGIRFNTASYNSITGNIIGANAFAIELMSYSNNNIITGNSDGGLPNTEGIILDETSANNEISDNNGIPYVPPTPPATAWIAITGKYNTVYKGSTATSQEPAVGLTISAITKSTGAVFSTCTTGSDGTCQLGVVPDQYIVRAETTRFPGKIPEHDIGAVKEGETKKANLAWLIKPDGSVTAANTKTATGSLLIIYEPVEISAEGTGYVPFVYETPDNYWVAAASLTPPSGCSVDTATQTVTVDQSAQAALFTLSCSGSAPTGAAVGVSRGKATIIHTVKDCTRVTAQGQHVCTPKPELRSEIAAVRAGGRAAPQSPLGGIVGLLGGDSFALVVAILVAAAAVIAAAVARRPKAHRSR